MVKFGCLPSVGYRDVVGLGTGFFPVDLVFSVVLGPGWWLISQVKWASRILIPYLRRTEVVLYSEDSTI